MATVTVQVLRSLLYRNERQEPGTRLDVPPIDAADLVATGRAVLVCPTDAQTLREAVVAETKAALKQRVSHHRDPDPRWSSLR